MNSITTTSNAARMANAVMAVATEVERTGIGVASITVDTYSSRVHGGDGGLTVKVQARSAAEARHLVGLFPGLPAEPHIYGEVGAPSATYGGTWTGMDFTVVIFGPAQDRASA